VLRILVRRLMSGSMRQPSPVSMIAG
jgi:hypothetical protein